MNRLRQLFESIVYAGMKPNAGPRQPAPSRGGPFRRVIDRILNGSPLSDPLYVYNRTPGQKVVRGILIGLPPALVLAGVLMATTGYFNRPLPGPAPNPLTNSETAPKSLPALNKDLGVPGNQQVEVVTVNVQQGSLSGVIRNNTDHLVVGVDVVFDLTNAVGSRLGTADCRIDRIDPRGTASFATVVPQLDAVYAIAREIHNR